MPARLRDKQLYSTLKHQRDLSVVLARCWWPDCVVRLTERQATWKQFVVGAVDWQTELEVSQQSDDSIVTAVGRQRRAQLLSLNQSVIVDGGVDAGDDRREHASQPLGVENHQLIEVG